MNHIDFCHVLNAPTYFKEEMNRDHALNQKYALDDNVEFLERDNTLIFALIAEGKKLVKEIVQEWNPLEV